MSWMPLDYAYEPKDGEGRPCAHLPEVEAARARNRQATTDRIAVRRAAVRGWLTEWRSRGSLARKVGTTYETIRRDLLSMDDLETTGANPARWRIRETG